ncbi:MAG: YkgJ family cysteine cluster protein [Magnetococcales bacterium]|nr:YkgJ family cysteine cluster protein [Magnetococcales bacterium]
MEKSALQEIINFQQQSVTDIFATAGSHREAVILSVADAHQWFDKLRKKLSSFKHIACNRGCGWCCRQKVSLTYAETFIIGWYVEEKITPGLVKDNIKLNVAQRWQNEDRLDSPARFATGIPCPFLDTGENLCLIHLVRPFSCRWYESLDELACKQPALQNSPKVNIPHDPRTQQLADAVEKGMLLGFKEQGLSNSNLIMTGALTTFWNDKNCFLKWRANQELFKDCQIATNTDHRG